MSVPSSESGSLTPSPASECVPPTPEPKGEDTHSPAGEERGSQFGRLEKKRSTLSILWFRGFPWITTLIKKKIKFSSYIGKFRVEQLQSHIWGRASWYIRKCANISPYMRRPLVIYDFATAPPWISLYMKKIRFSFLSVQQEGKRHQKDVAFFI